MPINLLRKYCSPPVTRTSKGNEKLFELARVRVEPELISRTNVASVSSVFNDTRKVKILLLPETIKEKSTFRAKALRRELVVSIFHRLHCCSLSKSPSFRLSKSSVLTF